VKVNSGDERRLWPCRGGEVKREGEDGRARCPQPAALPIPHSPFPVPPKIK
jgi:hypothetical protein